VASVNETASGDLVEIVNNFLMNHMFKKAKKVRFLVPLTLQQVTEDNGQNLKGQLDKVM